jgi:hypothetical protein
MKLVAALAAAVLGVALAPGTASADVSLRRDPVGDMARSPIGSSAYVPAPTQAQGDIVATRVFHGRRAIRVQVQLRDLTPAGNGNFHVFVIRSRWRQRTVEIDALPGHWAGRVTTTDGHGRIVPCAVRHRLDYDLNRVMVRIPRSCLHRPPWVQVAVRTTVAGTSHVYADDAGVAGFTGAFVFGPRVRS